MKIHFNDCTAEIADLKSQLVMAQQQNVEFAREIVELSCKIRQIYYSNKSIDCSTCKEIDTKKQDAQISTPITEPMLE